MEFTVFNDKTFSYEAAIITERTNENPDVSYYDVFKSEVTGTIEEPFISGRGIAKNWEISPIGCSSPGDPSENSGSYMYVTMDLGVEEGIPYLDIITFDEVQDPSYYGDVSTLSLDNWDAIETNIDNAIDYENLTSMESLMPRLYLQHGIWRNR